MIKNLRHVGLVVFDMNRAIKFYQMLGCKIIAQAEEKWGNERFQTCKLTNKIELIAPIDGDWFEHIALTVDEIPFDKLEAYTQFKPNVWFTQDPDGNVIELVKEEDL